MNNGNTTYLDLSQIKEMLYDNENYIREFAAATESSFNEFAENYEKFLLQRNEEKFRKAGHKIKPVAQMLGVDKIVEEYEHGKTLLWDDKNEDELKKSITRIKKICDGVIEELDQLK